MPASMSETKTTQENGIATTPATRVLLAHASHQRCQGRWALAGPARHGRPLALDLAAQVSLSTLAGRRARVSHQACSTSSSGVALRGKSLGVSSASAPYENEPSLSPGHCRSFADDALVSGQLDFSDASWRGRRWLRLRTQGKTGCEGEEARLRNVRRPGRETAMDSRFCVRLSGALETAEAR